jgi:lysyl-tRNA synthetase class 2
MNESNWKRLRTGSLDWSVFRMRHALMRSLRAFFDGRGYLETDVSLLVPVPTLDANIASIETGVKNETGKTRRMFLHTSPEYSMKKLLAAGADRLYFLGKVFRDGECTRLHNPEFTLLEWYRTPASIADLMGETEELVSGAVAALLGSARLTVNGRSIDLRPPWQRLALPDLFLEKTGEPLDPSLDETELKRIAGKAGVPFQPDEDCETVFHRIYLDILEPGLGTNRPVFLTDYPLPLGMNAREKEGDPRWADRVELYIGGLELANGYTEITESGKQRLRFESDRRRKTLETGTVLPIDEDLLDALEIGLPPCAGFALGVDRLLMLLADKTSIQDVLWYPFHQWET